jgi:hypothetical protein
MLSRIIAVLLALPCLVRAAADPQAISIEKLEGQGFFTIENAAVSDLSALVWLGGDSFYAVSDHQKALVPVTLKVDPANGHITAGEIGTPNSVQTEAGDFEGIAYVTGTKSFYIAAEQGTAVLRLTLDPPRTDRLAVPPIFAQARKNLSLEALTWNDTVKEFWIANEETLTPDGPVANANEGSLVRLQRLDSRFRPLAQYAWRTEPAGMRFRGAGSGVPDLCLLPDGRLLVLERGFGAAGLQARIYLADFKGATDISKLPALANAQFTPTKKTLLFEQATGFVNYEGIALGPKLADGSRSLLLIADSNGGPAHIFMPLKLRLPIPPAPAGRAGEKSLAKQPAQGGGQMRNRK